MNKLDLDYQKLLKDILDNGHQKGDRTGTGTISVFGRQIRHSMKNGFPMMTTNKMDFKVIVSELIKQLKENSDLNRLINSALNPLDIPHQLFSPCHYEFQVYTRELSLEERTQYKKKRGGIARTFAPYTHQMLDGSNIPTRSISLMFNMISVDTFLGLPFNIASYGLLLEIIGKVVNMVPEELIGNLGDVHLYSNHREQAEEQIGRELRVDERVCKIYENHKLDVSILKEGMTDLELSDICDKFGISKRSREPFSLPKLEINTNNKNWDVLSIDEIIDSLDIDLTFKIVDYESHPSIKATLSN